MKRQVRSIVGWMGAAALLTVGVGCGSSKAPAASGRARPSDFLTTPTARAFGIGGTIWDMVSDSTFWYFVGDFIAVNQTLSSRHIQLTLGGDPALTCSSVIDKFNNAVYAVAATSDAIFVGGTFTTFNGVSAPYLVKIRKSDCTLDPTFHPPGRTGVSDRVNALLVHGTSLYVGGNFRNFNGVSDAANRLAKLDVNTGALDTTFSPPGPSANGFNGVVYALVANGTSLYVAASASAYRGVANSANSVAKLDLVTGEIDTTFSPVGATANGFDQTVNALAIHGTSLYVGGAFTAYRGVANSARRVAKLDLVSGAIDTTFSPPGTNGFDSQVVSLAVANSSLYVGGYFSTYRTGGSALRLAKLDLATGDLDTTFSPPGANANGFGNWVSALAVSATHLYAGGGFTSYRNGEPANYIAKIDLTTGALDTTFKPVNSNQRGFNAGVRALYIDGNALQVGGDFIGYGGMIANRFAKIHKASGNLDLIVSPQTGANGFTSPMKRIVIVDDYLWLGGDFSTYRGQASGYEFAINRATGALEN